MRSLKVLILLFAVGVSAVVHARQCIPDASCPSKIACSEAPWSVPFECATPRGNQNEMAFSYKCTGVRNGGPVRLSIRISENAVQIANSEVFGTRVSPLIHSVTKYGPFGHLGTKRYYILARTGMTKGQPEGTILLVYDGYGENIELNCKVSSQ